MNSLRTLVFALMIVLPLSCHKPTEEDKVRKIIIDVQNATEEKNARTILDRISKTYRDPQGYDREGIQGLLAYYFFRHQKVSVFIPELDIRVANGTAQATFQTILTGRGTDEATGGVFPEALGVYNFNISLAKEGGEWKVTSASWKRKGDAPAPSTNP